MKRINCEIIFVLFMIVSIFIPVINNLWALQGEFKAIEELEKSEKKQPSEEAIIRPTVEYKADTLKDPFAEPIIEDKSTQSVSETAVVNPPPSLTVQGVIWGGVFPQAIINNKVVKEGDDIEGARVINIDKEGITVFFEGNQYFLSSPAAGIHSFKKP